MVDPITESDLAAYVDGQLDTMRCVEVEAHLADNPEDAARVMADLRDRDALREAFGPSPGLGPDRLRASARRIDRALAWQRVGARLRRAAVVVLFVGAGWLAHTEIGTFGVPDSQAAPVDPILVEQAREAREAVQMRARTQSQRASPSYDRADLEAATGLRLPDLPSDWTVRDVQVFPARHGPGVEVAIDAGSLGPLELFATRGTVNTVTADPVTRSGEATTAYWQKGEMAFALTGNREGDDLRAAAKRLAYRQ